MKKVRWHDNERVDAPDVRMLSDLVESYLVALANGILGEYLTGSKTDTGILWGMDFALGPPPNELSQATLSKGRLIDAARHLVVTTSDTTIDISAITNVENGELWARRNPTQLETMVEDRVMVVGGSEQVQQKTTRLEDRLEFQAGAPGAGPAGSAGWVHLYTFSAWAGDLPGAIMSEPPFAWGAQSLSGLIEELIEEVAAIKGVPKGSYPTHTASGWRTPIASTLKTVGARAGCVFDDDDLGDVQERSKAGTQTRNVDFAHADTTKVGVGHYRFKLTTSVVQADAIGHVSVTNNASDGNSQLDLDYSFTLDVSGGNITHVHVYVFDGGGGGMVDVTAAGLSWALF